MSFQLLPAIDLRAGRSVRLYQGELSQTTDYGDPIRAAQKFIESGAQWLHVVDLDAAFGQGDNGEVINQLTALSGINIELSGGIRDDNSLERALETGCKRINIGTAAIEKPEWVASVISRFGALIAISIDVRGRQVATRGWTESAGDIFNLISHFDRIGCQRYVVTDIERDGTLTGPNIELLRSVVSHTSRPVIASGGISQLNDLRELAALSESGLEGAIGKALYSGAFTIAEAMAVLS
jgi:1-(5-phosphoribosyl)-5-[(5-phosphoribosylamino)methylideneamino] imidazole-4-carboxamide isomerase/N-(5'phosphoribosyl)anthranilate isomerase